MQGKLALQCWNEIPDHFPNVELDEFIIMPNHIHGIIVIAGPDNYLPDHHDPVRAKNISPRHDEPVRANNYSPQQPGAPLGANNHSPLQPNNDIPVHPTGASKTVGSIIRGFKTGVTKWMRNPDNNPPVRGNNHSPLHDAPYGRNMFRPYGTVWQRNYYEHIVRDEPELFRIRKYILENPAKWYWDKMNPDMDTGAVRESDSSYGLEAWMV